MSWRATGGRSSAAASHPNPSPRWGEGFRSRRAARLFPSGGGVGSLLPAGRRVGDEGVRCGRLGEVGAVFAHARGMELQDLELLSVRAVTMLLEEDWAGDLDHRFGRARRDQARTKVRVPQDAD